MLKTLHRTGDKTKGNSGHMDNAMSGQIVLSLLGEETQTTEQVLADTEGKLLPERLKRFHFLCGRLRPTYI